MGASRSGLGSHTADGRYLMPSPDLIRVEEFINYHRHELPLPDGEQRVRLNVRQRDLDSGKSVLQFGLTTPRALNPERVAPLNLVLVIDRSGSMSGDRIAHVKKALHVFIERLRKFDKVCIVSFSNSAGVVLEATEKTKIHKIRAAIDSIVTGGSTNLHEGLMLGYRQAAASYDRERTNRVILLSDGIANSGVVDLAQIARESKEFNEDGIDLSTIGLGHNLNHQLLRELADSGRGLIHFVGDSKDIEKTFVNEADSLLAPAARDVRLTIDFGNHADAVGIFGYRPKRKGKRFVFNLDNLNHGATQVVMAQLSTNLQEKEVSAVLSYTDALTREKVEIRESLGDHQPAPEERRSVAKNFAIALVADSIKRAAVESHGGDCNGAAKELKKGMKAARKMFNQPKDEDLNRVLGIAKDYRRQIQASTERRDASEGRGRVTKRVSP